MQENRKFGKRFLIERCQTLKFSLENGNDSRCRKWDSRIRVAGLGQQWTNLTWLLSRDRFVVVPEDTRKFEAYMKLQLSGYYTLCDAAVRHKFFVAHWDKLKENNIRVNKVRMSSLFQKHTRCRVLELALKS